MALSLEHTLINFLEAGQDRQQPNGRSVLRRAVKRVGNHSATMFERGFCCIKAETWEEKKKLAISSRGVTKGRTG
jgi:hypothetical protein